MFRAYIIWAVISADVPSRRSRNVSRMHTPVLLSQLSIARVLFSTRLRPIWTRVADLTSLVPTHHRTVQQHMCENVCRFHTFRPKEFRTLLTNSNHRSRLATGVVDHDEHWTNTITRFGDSPQLDKASGEGQGDRTPLYS